MSRRPSVASYGWQSAIYKKGDMMKFVSFPMFVVYSQFEQGGHVHRSCLGAYPSKDKAIERIARDISLDISVEDMSKYEAPSGRPANYSPYKPVGLYRNPPLPEQVDQFDPVVWYWIEDHSGIFAGKRLRVHERLGPRFILVDYRTYSYDPEIRTYRPGRPVPNVPDGWREPAVGEMDEVLKMMWTSDKY